MPDIKKVTPLTENPHVNLYHLDVESKKGTLLCGVTGKD